MAEHDKTRTLDGWQSCAEGQLQQVADRQRSRRRTRRLSRVASATTIVAVLVVGTFVGTRHWLEQQTQPIVPGPNQHFVEGISCAEVIKLLPAYVNDTLHRQDPELYERVFAHLQQCPNCHALKNKLRESQSILRADESSVARSATNRSLLVTQDLHFLAAQPNAPLAAR